MSTTGKRKLPPIIEHLMDLKRAKPVQQNTLDSFWTDANAILEALLAELDEGTIIDAMTKQTFAGDKYVPNLRTLITEAKKRRTDRITGPLAKRVKERV